MTKSHLAYEVTNHHPVSIHGLPAQSLPYAEEYRDLISVDVIHDGCHIPPEYLVDENNEAIDPELVHHHYVLERDWGANVVAQRLAESLALSSFFTVNTARCLLDFGRFPGITKPGASHLGRFAINHPFSQFLGYHQKQSLLQNYYDSISQEMENHLNNRLLKIAIHTYDRFNKSGTERPQVSLVTRMLGYQMESRMPIGVFDPLYPDILADFTVDRVLRDRVSLTLEKKGIPVAHNYPYLLPEGSIEVRHQVWRFFKWLKSRFENYFPDTTLNPPYEQVWKMLKDTNLRSAEAGSLRSVLHLFRHPPSDKIIQYESAINAYHHIANFVKSDNSAIIEEYRHSSERCMALGIEVRKDLIWEIDEMGRPIALKPDRGLIVAETIAAAIITYLNEDREERLCQLKNSQNSQI